MICLNVWLNLLKDIYKKMLKLTTVRIKTPLIFKYLRKNR